MFFVGGRFLYFLHAKFAKDNQFIFGIQKKCERKSKWIFIYIPWLSNEHASAAIIFWGFRDFHILFTSDINEYIIYSSNDICMLSISDGPINLRSRETVVFFLYCDRIKMTHHNKWCLCQIFVIYSHRNMIWRTKQSPQNNNNAIILFSRFTKWNVHFI